MTLSCSRDDYCTVSFAGDALVCTCSATGRSFWIAGLSSLVSGVLQLISPSSASTCLGWGHWNLHKVPIRSGNTIVVCIAIACGTFICTSFTYKWIISRLVGPYSAAAYISHRLRQRVTTDKAVIVVRSRAGFSINAAVFAFSWTVIAILLRRAAISTPSGC